MGPASRRAGRGVGGLRSVGGSETLIAGDVQTSATVSLWIWLPFVHFEGRLLRNRDARLCSFSRSVWDVRVFWLLLCLLCFLKTIVMTLVLTSQHDACGLSHYYYYNYYWHVIIRILLCIIHIQSCYWMQTECWSKCWSKNTQSYL